MTFLMNDYVHKCWNADVLVGLPGTLQGGPSASGKIYVDIKFKVPSLA